MAREPADPEQAGQALLAESSLLMASLAAAWSASLLRTSIFLAVLSAAGVALGFVAQRGIDSEDFRLFALVVLPLVYFLGVATFVRLVQVQREAIVYITGLNRIRGFLAAHAPAARPYLVLPVHDDDHALYRSQGTGMSRRGPRFRLLYLAVQTQGIVGLMTGVVAGAFAGLALAPLGQALMWAGAGGAFVLTVGALLGYWQRSMIELQSSIRPISPTPPDEIGAPF